MQACAKPSDLLEQLRAFDIFKDVTDDGLLWLIDRSEYLCLEEGDQLFVEGDKADYMQIMLKGSFLIRRIKDGRQREVGFWEAPYVTGVLPFSRMTHATANGIVVDPMAVLRLHRDCFTDMVNTSYVLTQALVAVMTERVRDFQQIRLMDEKLMALGKMSAGLAHELNNPASAMVRSSRELHKHLASTPERFKALVTMRVSAEDVDVINGVLFERIAAHDESKELSLMEREERSDDLTDWFEDHDIDNSDEILDTLIDWNFEPDHLDQIAEVLPAEALTTVLWWVETTLTTEGLVDEIQTASTRIAELITSIKSYSHMDNEPSMEFVDVHKGIYSTITMLKFRFKKQQVALEKIVDKNLPHIKALEGELNQVWTNLISNALDALPQDGTGKLTIRTYHRRDNLCIEFEDNGPGIPEDIQRRVFDPFFTTKGIGEGTGMGLDIVRR
ncbi:MAG: ATP-binding protein, partial [Bacteroidota bacterium]